MNPVASLRQWNFCPDDSYFNVTYYLEFDFSDCTYM